MRIIFLAASAVALLAVAAGLSVQAGRSPTASAPALPQAVAAAPMPPALNTEIAEATTPLSGPAEQRSAAPVIRVKSIRIEPERPPLTPEVERPAPTAADNQERESAAMKQLSAALAAPQSRMAPAEPAPEARTKQVKRPVIAAKRSAHSKRKLRSASTDRSADRVASGEELPPVTKPGPESLNPLGKLLTQGKL